MIDATDLSVGGNVSIGVGTHADGTSMTLENLTIKGSVAISTLSGSNTVEIQRGSAGNSYIMGNLSVSTGAAGSGGIETLVSDTSIGGNVTIHNGPTTGTDATDIYDNANTTVPLTIGKNVLVTNTATASLTDGLWDGNVLGNVTFAEGSGAATTYLDGYHAGKPTVVLGSVKITGTGTQTDYLGSQYKFGLMVGKSLTVKSGAAGDTIDLLKTTVGGPTSFGLAGSNSATNNINIDGSTFEGTFSLVAGKGTANFEVEQSTSNSIATIFNGAAMVTLVGGTNNATIGGVTNDSQQVFVDSTFVVHYGIGGASAGSNVYYPFGNEIQF